MFTVHPQCATRTLHEYQFLPEQPTVRTDTYERAAPSYHYGSPVDSSNTRNPSLSTGHSFMHGNEQVSSGYGFPGQLPSLNLLSQQGRQNHLLPSASEEYENVPRKNSFVNTALDAHFGAHAITALENQFVSSDRRVTLDEDASRMEKKRKSEEARIAREVEAHEKRIRKELEKQDILRRKREEQIRKEMERHDRERRKEEERLLREKQREEERYLREQRRELERREKFLQKESIRAEKMRQKEELRREKEAARLRAANERAIARKIAKESMELIEDERLELMELAASSKGLPTILSLDFETLQNLESFRDVLCPFPPKSVKLKRPFAILPWNGSEENVGNLLMVWRFLITFADILGLWPFTLDEFVQAFHDYDPRLLGEIHIALLRSIIKDMEDAVKTPVTGLGTNQSSAANPGGGHPQIVKGAYSWGFNIRSWQHHLNALTWPEILRQFALSAGFGPQLKKRNIEQACLHDDYEGSDGGDIISNLRNGAAAENAVAIMQERGFSNSRRSRHRLTPGTVKFAAFHVLSLEGSKGLTILEVADKIQKSGLRDLTTSKTPEASISAALSRDSKLFERTAPSTYCVRTAYRKDPVDSEAILSAARERVRIFNSGFIDGEEADDAERDEGSESDVAEDPEDDDLGTELNLKEEKPNSREAKNFTKTLLGNRTETNEVTEIPLGGLGRSGEGLSSKSSEGFCEIKGSDGLIGQSINAAEVCLDATTTGQANADIDESNPGEPWVQGLMEGEYSDLTVEERLNALVALVGVAIEGNSIRIVLEERLEAANAIKKQMWVEAQLDKRRIKEDYVSKMNFSAYMGNKTEPNVANSSVEGRQSPFVVIDDKNNETSVDLTIKQELLNDQQHDHNCMMPPEGNLQMQDYTIGIDNLQYQQAAYAAEKSRSQLKSYIGHRAEEMYVYRSLPLGQDRRRNRYWRFITSVSRNDPGCGRIFVELRDGHWRLIDSEEDFDALLASLDLRGVRESHLHSMLQKIEMSFKDTVRRSMVDVNTHRQNQETAKPKSFQTVPCPDCNIDTDSPSSTVCVSDSDMSETSTTFLIGLGRNVTERNDALKRYEDYERWMWNECANSLVLCAMKYVKKRCKQVMSACDYCHDIYLFEGNHCPSCHGTFNAFNRNLNVSEHVAQCEGKLKRDHDCTSDVSLASPMRIRLLKLLLSFVEVCIPPEALQPDWTDGRRKSWGTKLHSSLSAAELIQGLTQLESAIKRDYLSTNFETTSELLDSSNALAACTPNGPSSPETVCILPWVPHTTAAVALRLMEFDASISYLPHQKVESHQKDKKEGDIVKFPSKYAVVKNSRVDEAVETSYQASYSQEGNWIDVGIRLAGQNRGRTNRGRIRGRTQGGRSQRRVGGSRSESGKKSTNINKDRLGQVLVWKEQPRGRGPKRGRRSARSRQKAAKKVVGVVGERETPKESIFEQSRNLVRDEWNRDEMTKLQEERAENHSSFERSEYDDENGQATGDEYDDMLDTYGGSFDGRLNDQQEGSDYNLDGNEEDEDDEEGDLDVEEYLNEESDEEGMRVGDEERNVDPEQGTGSTSTDFSD
ncbi:homeobox-DDT domain protein RLT2 isoform X3 [Pistacia vera]|nr:homeobox-DDT domain protein RLT2 isoform X3 [Pistacia vera]